MKNNWILYVGAIVVIAFIAIIWTNSKGGGVASPEMDKFATCIKDSGTTFFGAFWCPHCAAQKALFGASVKLLPYVECSNPDGNSQTPICIANKITNYPTWVFPDHSTSTGEQTLANLAAKTNCPLPSTSTP